MLRAPSHDQPLLLAPPSPRFQAICVQLCPFTCPDGTALRAGTGPPQCSLDVPPGPLCWGGITPGRQTHGLF